MNRYDLDETMTKHLLQVAKLIKENLIDEVQNGYQINIIDELHANENAHSRILQVLLNYKGDGEYPILKSFIRMISKECNLQMFTQIDINKPKIDNEWGRIDLSIQENGKYGIIIENKINGAVDQYQQIERYIKDMSLRSQLDTTKIVVIYLTDNGAKEISDISLTKWAKEKLNADSIESRFCPLNFEHHILPWLEKKVLPNCKIQETLLISAIQQYIDYLKGLFKLRPQQIIDTKKMNNMINEKLDIKSIEDAFDNLNNIQELQSMLIQDIDSMISTIAEDKIISKLKHDISSIEDLSLNNYKIGLNVFSLEIGVKGWNKCTICFSLEKTELYCGIAHYDANQNHISEEIQEQIHSLNLGESSYWWPLEINMTNEFNPKDFEEWKKLEKSSDNNIENCIWQHIKDIYDKTPDIEL